MSGKYSWSPANYLFCDKIKNAKKFAVIVLNRPINLDRDLVECLWNQGEINSEFNKSEEKKSHDRILFTILSNDKNNC